MQGTQTGHGSLSLASWGRRVFNGLGEGKPETVPTVQAEYAGEHIADATESGSMNTHRDPGELARG
jgi:hypothetical protein